MTEPGPKVLESNRESKEEALAELFELFSQSDGYIVIFATKRDGRPTSGGSFGGNISRSMVLEMLTRSSNTFCLLEKRFDNLDEQYQAKVAH